MVSFRITFDSLNAKYLSKIQNVAVTEDPQGETLSLTVAMCMTC